MSGDGDGAAGAAANGADVVVARTYLRVNARSRSDRL